MIQTKDQASAERAAQEERERRDWFDMMQSEAAFRVWARLLDEWGANRLMVTEEDMRRRNIADLALDRMADACPDVYIRMVRALKQI